MKIVLYALLATFSFSQVPDTAWTKVYGGNAADQGFDVQQTSDGGYIVVGATSSYGAGNNDIWLLKTDEYGDTIWSKTYGYNGWDYGRAVIETSDNGFLIAGSKRAVDHSRTDFWVIKTNSQGDSLWSFDYGWDSVHYAAEAVCEDNNNNYAVVGDVSYEAGSSSGYFIKIDDMGQYIWDRQLSFMGNDIKQTFDNGYIIVGTYRDGWTGFYWAYEKADSGGNQIWYKNYVSGGWLYSVQQLPDSGFVMTGCRDYSGYHVGLLRTDIFGDTLWVHSYGTGPYYSGNSIALTSDNGFVIGADRSNDVWILRTDSLGDTIGIRIYSGRYINSIKRTSDFGYIAVGTTAQYSGSDDIWLLKFEPDTLKIKENVRTPIRNPNEISTIFNGPLHFPADAYYKIFDITGREINTLDPAPGIYFIQVDGEIRQKVIKIK